jgi:hypothetical protein
MKAPKAIPTTPSKKVFLLVPKKRLKGTPGSPSFVLREAKPERASGLQQEMQQEDVEDNCGGNEGDQLLSCSCCGGSKGQANWLYRCAYTKAIQYCSKECAETPKSCAIHEAELMMRLVQMGRPLKLEPGSRGYCDFVRLGAHTSRRSSVAGTDCLLSPGEGWAANWTPAQQVALRAHQQAQQNRLSNAGKWRQGLR